MADKDTQQSTTTSGATNPFVDSTVSRVLEGLQNEMGNGTAVFNKPLYTGLSGTTRAGLQNIGTAADAGAGGLGDAFNWARGTVNSGGYNPALSSAQSGIEGYLRESQADAPGYATLRAGVADDTMSGINEAFNASGRFGGGSNVESASKGLGSALAGLDYQNYGDRLSRQLGGNQALAGIGQTAMGNAAGASAAMPSLFSGTLMPGQAQVGAGAIMEADALASRQAENDLFRRQNDSMWDTLGRSTSILAGNAGASGQTQTTTTPTAPWWQTGVSLLGQFI